MTPRPALVLLPAVLALLVLAPSAALAQPATFADTAGSVHEEAVAALVQEGIVRGCDDDSFCARDVLTRAQAATMLVAAFDLPLAAGPQFRDTADSSHRESISAMADAGLVAGCGDDKFCPDEPVTREQLATMLQTSFDVPDASSDTIYFDDTDGMHQPAVRALAAAGIASGCNESLTSFCAAAAVERAHAAMFLARTLNLVDRVELPPFEERKEEQDQLDQAAAEARAEAKAAAEAKAEAEAEAKAVAAAEAAAAAAAKVAAPGEEAVEVALAQLGKPYRWGGSGPGSFDCSGLTSYAWAKAGERLPRSSRAQYAATTRISRDELRPGDLVFYHSPVSHVAMYIGDGKVVESPNSGNDVRVRKDGLTRRGVVGFGRP